ncbi:MAG TPA: M15 family peptidase [Epsilonproteobacteria bacterium]|jgi:hypothetical protein|nr:M15 family peptidase [Campylobacterota bacterium]
MKLLLILLVLINTALAKYSCNINPISVAFKQEMIKKNSWHKGCPIELNELSYVKVKYYNFDSQESTGALIVNNKIADITCKIFQELYNIKYPIEKIHPVSYYNANDELSMKNNNTSAFNCRLMTGSSSKWSNHSYGLAIDINPLINPYLSKHGNVSPKNAKRFVLRKHTSNNVFDKAKLVKGDTTIKVFKHYGFIWGGDWKSIKDFQHFEYKPRQKNHIKTIFENLHKHKDLF